MECYLIFKDGRSPETCEDTNTDRGVHVKGGNALLSNVLGDDFKEYRGHLEGVLKAQNGRGSEDADDRQNLAPRDAIIEV